MAENIHEGHRKRLRKKLIELDFHDKIDDHIMLETLLFYAIPRRDTNVIAHSLLNKFGSIYGVFEADAFELMQVDGINENAATLIKLMLPLFRRYYNNKYTDKKQRFQSIDQIGEYLMNKHSGYKDEIFILSSFTSEGVLISSNILSKGDASTVNVSIKEIVKTALNHNAPCVIISHNHFSGNALPSNNDIEMTQKLKDALELLGIKLLDHIIVAGNDFISMAQSREYFSIFR